MRNTKNISRLVGGRVEGVGNFGAGRLRSRVLAATLFVMSIALAACNSATIGSETHSDDDVIGKIGQLDLSPRYPRQVLPEQSPAARRARAEIYSGTDDPYGAQAAATPSSTQQAAAASPPVQLAAASSTPVGNGFELNFENTPVATVAKVVLGDILGVGYTIDPRIQGTVSLSSVRPVPKSDILYVLENALRLSGTALVRDASGYRLIPLGDAAGAGNVDPTGGSPEAGYGISVVPLQYVSAQTLLKLLDSFALKPGTVRADPGRNILVIQGTGTERRAAVEAALSFDADWMRGQSVGIFPIVNGNPEPIVAELEKIMDTGESGLGQNVVKFQTISRMNAVMVISRKPVMLHTAETWIKRLDGVNALRNTVHVYRVKYGEARQMAKVLNDMFTGNSGASDAASNDLAPGSGSTSNSSMERLSAAGTTSQSGGFASPSQGNVNSGNGLVANRGFGGTPPPTSVSLDSNSDAHGASGSGKPPMEGVRITPDVVNNTLLIYADRENYRVIESTLRQCDRPQLQVAIDATIAEVTLNDTLSYGVQAYLTSKNLGLKPDQGSLLNTTATSAPTTVASAAGTVTNAFLSRAFPGFNFLIGSESQPSAILDALHTVTDVKVLSNPSLVVIDNQVATLQVGDQVPVSTGSATVLTTNNTVVNTIDYRNTGIILRVAPRVNENGNVRLEIEQEISNVSPTTANSLTPTVAERKVKSSVAVASGQTVLLAGLISETHLGTRNGIPGVDQIPNFGDLFAHNDRTTGRTELIIFIRPQIVRDGTDAHYVAEELRSKLRGTVKPVTESALQAPRVQ
jgi:general secretion pathway protein D